MNSRVLPATLLFALCTSGLIFALAAPSFSQDETTERANEPKPPEVKLDGIFEATEATAIRIRLEKTDKVDVIEAVSHGQSVLAGETLIRIDTSAIEQAIKAAKASLETAQTELLDAEIKMELAERSQRLALAAAERADEVATEELKEFVANGRDARIQSLERSVESAENRLAYQREELNQLIKMYEADDLTEETEEIILRRTKDAVKSAEYSLELAQQSRRKGLEFSLRRESQQLETSVAQAALALEEARRMAPQSLKRQRLSLDAKRRAISEQEESLAELQHDLDAVAFVAPHDGTIYLGVYKNGSWSDANAAASTLEPGASLKNNATPMTVVKLRPLRVRVMVPEESLRLAKLDATVVVSSVAFPDVLIQGKIKSVAKIPTGGKFECLIEIIRMGDNDRIVPGMTATVTLAPEQTKTE